MNENCPRGAGGRLRRAFTLIELLLVVAIIAVVTAVTMPSLVRSIHGNRLRAAARTVATAGRYARSMALLTQREMRLRFDLDESRVSVAPAGPPPTQVEAEGPALVPADEAPTQGPAGPAAETGGASPTAEGGGGTSADKGFDRELDGVRIVSVTFSEEGIATRGTGAVAVQYATNGRCTPYVVRLADERGDETVISVDVLGEAEASSK
jgi:prepilin-type N-terminal cleavage/methylation domain-containing protein